MKNFVKLIGIIALVAAIGFSFVACDSGGGGGGPGGEQPGGDPQLSGSITISPNTGVITGTELTASYSGSETVSYQWKKGSTNVGTNSNKFTPAEAGSYTVTVRATGYTSKTSAAVAVTDLSLPALSGNITISPNTGVEINTELTAEYSGSETVSFQWNKDGQAVSGATSTKYTPTVGGSYTVTASAAGYISKTSAIVDVIDPSLSMLSGSITISPSPDVNINTELTANYSGSETVTYRWEKDGTIVGTNSNKYTPTNEGSYTVTVGAAGYNSKTSAAVTVADGTSGLAYTLINNGTAYRVKKGTVTSGAVVIPATYNGLPVTEIGASNDYTTSGAFAGTSITSITIPNSVTSIGYCAFYRCSNLTVVTFAADSRLETIDGEAFSSCTGLISITIPNSVTSIVHNAFYGCRNLTSITIPAGVTTIGGGTFRECESLTSITIPAGVTSIGAGAFTLCTSLTTVTFAPNSSLETIGYQAFHSCSNITSITIPSGVTEIGGYAFCNWTASQTINVQGKADRAATITAGWDSGWDASCSAVIVYQP